jgi:hypothetical protein
MEKQKRRSCTKETVFEDQSKQYSSKAPPHNFALGPKMELAKKHKQKTTPYNTPNNKQNPPWHN